MTHLLYTRFHSVSSTVSPLLGELERRARAHPDQLSSLLAECHVAYFGARKSLLVGVGKVVDEIKGLDPGERLHLGGDQGHGDVTMGGGKG